MDEANTFKFVNYVIIRDLIKEFITDYNPFNSLAKDFLAQVFVWRFANDND